MRVSINLRPKVGPQYIMIRIIYRNSQEVLVGFGNLHMMSCRISIIKLTPSFAAIWLFNY